MVCTHKSSHQEMANMMMHHQILGGSPDFFEDLRTPQPPASDSMGPQLNKP